MYETTGRKLLCFCWTDLLYVELHLKTRIYIVPCRQCSALDIAGVQSTFVLLWPCKMLYGIRIALWIFFFHFVSYRTWWRTIFEKLSFYCNNLFLCCLPQGLYEYVMPAWAKKYKPSPVDVDMKTFGNNIPAIPSVADPKRSDVVVAGHHLPR